MHMSKQAEENGRLVDVRFVVLIDIEGAASLEAAYRELRTRLASIGYETADEFYIDGDEGDPEDLTAVRLRVLAGEQP